MDKTKICYVDNDIDNYLSNYLSEICLHYDFDYEDIQVFPEDSYNDIVKKIIERKCQIAILDSKLYNDANAKQKITGQELELVLADQLPFLFPVVISQNDDVNNYNYIPKYKSRRGADNKNNSIAYYNEHLLPLLVFAKNKYKRNQDCFAMELSKNNSIDSVLLENVKSLLEGKGKIELTKEDIDQIVIKLGEIQKYEG